MSTIACLAAFFGASACWGVIGWNLGYRAGRRDGYTKGFRSYENVRADIVAYITDPCDCPDCRMDPDAALDAEIKGSK